METSTLNGANGTRAHGIVPLSMKEIELVAGAKASSPPPRSLWERILNWLSGGDSVQSPPQPIPMPPSDVIQACIEAGGSFSYDYSSGSGSVLMTLIRGDGTGTTIRIRCE